MIGILVKMAKIVGIRVKKKLLRFVSDMIVRKYLQHLFSWFFKMQAQNVIMKDDCIMEVIAVVNCIIHVSRFGHLMAMGELQLQPVEIGI